MRIIPIEASRKYDVVIGSGILSSVGERSVSLVNGRSAAIVSDSTVWPLYGDAVRESYENAGFRTVSYVFSAGEASKNGNTYLELLNFLAENHLTRSDLIVALGGGVVGDLTGFAAATYLRGIAFIQIPTTLLAAVDSSVGGKTAIDLPAGKNLCGAFYQPSLVLCDIETLDTLPTEIFRDGSAEVIKYGVLYDPELFEHLLTNGMNFDRESVIARCVEWKRDVVMQDEFDFGARQKLNLGHTIGHGVEAQSNFTVSHGKAVAIGMAIVARAGTAMRICTPETRDMIRSALNVFGLPTRTEFTAEALYASALSDKKRSGGTVNLIIPRVIGDCRICPMPVEQILPFIEVGL